MKILLVEDDALKRTYIIEFLKSRNIDVHWCYSVNPAIKYCLNNLKKVSGIILDLGLTSYDKSNDYEFEKGLVLVKELTRKKIKIPILINSTTYINLPMVMESHNNVKGQMYEADDYETLRWFINLLEGKEQ